MWASRESSASMPRPFTNTRRGARRMTSTEMGGPRAAATAGAASGWLCGPFRSITSMVTTLGRNLVSALIWARSMSRRPSIATFPSAARVTTTWPLAVASAMSLSNRRKRWRSSLRLEPPPRTRLIDPDPETVPDFSSLALKVFRVIRSRCRSALSERLVSTRPVAVSWKRPRATLASPVIWGSFRVPPRVPARCVWPSSSRSPP